MLFKNIASLVKKLKCSLLFNSRIIPCIRPDHFNSCFRIYRFYTECKRIDTAETFRNRECRNIADLTGCSFFSCNNAGKVACFISTSEICRNIRRAFISVAVTELHIREFGCDFYSSIHESEAGGINDIAALVDQIADGFFCIGIFRNVLDIHAFDPFSFKCKTSFIVSLSIAFIINRSDVDKTDFERVFCQFRSFSGCLLCAAGESESRHTQSEYCRGNHVLFHYILLEASASSNSHTADNPHYERNVIFPSGDIESIMARLSMRIPLRRSCSPPSWNPFSMTIHAPCASAPAFSARSFRPERALPFARKSSTRSTLSEGSRNCFETTTL